MSMSAVLQSVGLNYSSAAAPCENAR